MTALDDAHLSWAASAIGPGATVESARSLHEGMSPWLLRLSHAGTERLVVLRVAGRIWPKYIGVGAAALRTAESLGVAAPRLIAADLDGSVTGAPASLETYLEGTSEMPRRMSVPHLRAAGAALARVHAHPMAATADLELRTRPTQVDDRSAERRWAALYRSHADRSAVVDALRELTGMAAADAVAMLEANRQTPLLQLAEDLVVAHGLPGGETVFVHGDVWAGNLRWGADLDVCLIDWKTAGVGAPGVDLGSLRMQMALQHGPAAPSHVLAGWEEEAGRAASDVAYWDAVAALNTPADLDGWGPSWDDNGLPNDAASVTARRDAFLRAAVDELR